MSINQEILPSLSQWNSFHYIKYTIENLVYGFDVDVKTKILTVNKIPERQTFRLDLISELNEKGLSNNQISDYLNERGILSPLNHKYTQKLIWGTLKKIQGRKNRLLDTEVFIGEKFLFIIKK
jgi:hypothetical protein